MLVAVNVSVVIPCYRSADTIRPVVDGILANLRGDEENGIRQFEILLVVDGSPDDTAAVARRIAVDHPQVRVVELARNYGQHNALLAGILRARHEVIVTMDDDLQHRPDQIRSLLAPLEAGEADLVYGVARDEEHGLLRSAASRATKRMLQASGVPRAQDVSAFRALRTRLRDGFADVRDPYISLDVLLSWTTTAVAAVPVTMEQRANGSSGYTVRSLVRHAMNMVTGYSNLPLRVVTWLGMVTAFIGVVLGIVVIAKFAVGDTTVAGFTTIAAMVALFSGAQMLSLGVIGEYLGRMHTRSMGRPAFVVKSDTGATERR